MSDEDYEPGYRLTADTYLERLKRGHKAKKVEDDDSALKKANPVVAGADYIASIPHAPWPSRAMLKVRPSPYPNRVDWERLRKTQSNHRFK